MTNKQPKIINLNEKEAIVIAAHFDGESENSSLLKEQNDRAEVKRMIENLSISREFLNRWFKSRFIDSQGHPYQASLWDKIETSLIAPPVVESNFLAKIVGQHFIRPLTFYTRELAVAGAFVVVLFAFVFGYGAYGNKTQVAQSFNQPSRSLLFVESGFSEYNGGINFPTETTIFRGDNIHLVNDSKPLDLRSRSNLYRKTYSEVHSGVVDIEWINSDRSVSILNAGSMKTPPVIWIGKKRFEIN